MLELDSVQSKIGILNSNNLSSNLDIQHLISQKCRGLLWYILAFLNKFCKINKVAPPNLRNLTSLINLMQQILNEVK